MATFEQFHTYSFISKDSLHNLLAKNFHSGLGSLQFILIWGAYQKKSSDYSTFVQLKNLLWQVRYSVVKRKESEKERGKEMKKERKKY